MVKKYRKNKRVVEAVKFIGSQKSVDEIQKLIGIQGIYDFYSGRGGKKRFRIMCKKGGTVIYETNWIVFDDPYFFVVSDDVFKNMFTEV